MKRNKLIFNSTIAFILLITVPFPYSRMEMPYVWVEYNNNIH